MSVASPEALSVTLGARRDCCPPRRRYSTQRTQLGQQVDSDQPMMATQAATATFFPASQANQYHHSRDPFIHRAALSCFHGNIVHEPRLTGFFLHDHQSKLLGTLFTVVSSRHYLTLAVYHQNTLHIGKSHQTLH